MARTGSYLFLTQFTGPALCTWPHLHKTHINDILPILIDAMLKLKPNQVISRFTARNGTVVTFRTPRSSDLDDLLRYINGLVDEEAMILMNKRTNRKEEAAWLRNVLSKLKSGTAIYLAVEVNGQVVGLASVEQLRWRESHVGNLGISIAEGYREIGIGKRLMKELIRLSRKKGLKLLVLDAFEKNPRALHVYESVGFKTYGVIPKQVFHKGKYGGSVKMAREI